MTGHPDVPRVSGSAEVESLWDVVFLPVKLKLLISNKS